MLNSYTDVASGVLCSFMVGAGKGVTTFLDLRLLSYPANANEEMNKKQRKAYNLVITHSFKHTKRLHMVISTADNPTLRLINENVVEFTKQIAECEKPWDAMEAFATSGDTEHSEVTL